MTRGGFPQSYNADTNSQSLTWRQGYIRTFLEQDLPALGIRGSLTTVRKLWMMLVHFHGQQMNYHQLGASLGCTGPTARFYVDLVHRLFMIRLLEPWHANIKKRQVKMPKVYFRDSGILLSLLKLSSFEQVTHHPLSEPCSKAGLSKPSVTFLKTASSFIGAHPMALNWIVF